MLKIMFVMMLFFLAVFIVLHFTGLLSGENVQSWAEAARDISPVYVIIGVILLMYADLFLAIPTIPVMILAGSLLGTVWGSLASTIGLLLAGVTGYGISLKYGEMVMTLILKDQSKRDQAIQTYLSHGSMVILLSRAVPMLPEISACMAGMTGMPFGKFLLLWLASIVPCSILSAYAGSLSSMEDPSPAIFVAVGVSVTFWLGWFFYTKKKRSDRRISD